MPAARPTILATSMGFNRARLPWQPGPIFRYAVDLAGGPARPRLCVVTTASGDQEATISECQSAFAGSGLQVSHLALFSKPNVPDVAAHLHEQDVIWVDRGSLVNLLAVWRAHGLDKVLRDCWETGVVLAGESAGSLCWHACGTTDSFGSVRGHRDGLGFLPYANGVHHADRRASLHTLISDGPCPIGFATDAGAGLHYEGSTLVAAISDRKNAGAYRLQREPDGSVLEERLEVTRLRR